MLQCDLLNAMPIAVPQSEFHLIILPTEKCNFRCKYCYEDFKIGRMSDDVQAGIKSFFDEKSRECSRIMVSWFGGEPLVAQDIVLNLAEQFNTLSNKNECILFSDMTTNGYFLEENLLNLLVDFGVNRFQITLDGEEEYHDIYRTLADGRGTFKKIWRNICNSRNVNRNFTIMIRTHYAPHNIENVEPFVARLIDEFGGDQRYKFFVRPLSRLGGADDKDIEIFKDRERRLIKDVLAKIPNENLFYDDTRNPICYAAKTNSLVFRADGSIGKCTVALNDERNSIGKIDKDGKISISNEKLLPWVEQTILGNFEKSGCPYLYI